ncbi:glycine cleavage system H protein [Saccharomonospora amisosensis]|uniref:Glycine cleavage system H protein n=1 Tax=Saccharomonospora amisosensis TaxID=1128677 RepID=A0A7X5URT4_9PSEU|nr:glycine cleavage system protein H [Saccharomonospora amisosensis]NIJ13011.1 glycine cleavage system H protein [Saccharomonospora amisosensis]
MTNTHIAGGDALVEIRGYPLAMDRMYDPETHVWAKPTAPGQLRLGLDPLGVETSGTLAQLSFAEPGERLVRGKAFGQLEAAKFVGPLVSPLSGTTLAVNEAVLADPGLVESDPFAAGWLLELAHDEAAEFSALLSQPEEIKDWFARKVDDYRLRGVIAE